jgi:hypothetical protein
MVTLTISVDEQPAAVPQALTAMMPESLGISQYENTLFKA